jgi:hypothetical protein
MEFLFDWKQKNKFAARVDGTDLRRVKYFMCGVFLRFELFLEY